MPIIVLTANTADNEIAEYAAAGIGGVIGKPLDREVLISAIDAALHPAGRAARNRWLAGSDVAAAAD